MNTRLAYAVMACASTVAISASATHVAEARDSRPVRPLASRAPLGTERLSDERTVTRYASALVRAAVRRRPQHDSSRVTRLRYSTEAGSRETYLVLASRVDATSRTWLQIRTPGRPNGRTGWVEREHLGPFGAVTTFLRINRRNLRATLFRRGRQIWSSPIGVGKASTPTPAGSFWIRTRLKVTKHGSAYGPWAFGTAAYSVLSEWPGGGVIGIHGTNQPGLIPGRPSHGCVRVPNRRIRRLARLMPIGTPIRIV